MSNVHWTLSFNLFIANWGTLGGHLDAVSCGAMIYLLCCLYKASVCCLIAIEQLHLYKCTVYLFMKGVYGSLFSSPEQDRKA